MINISELEKKLKIKMKNKSLLTQALRHKSLDSINNNEKLEFLGDRVIGLVLSKKLLDLYPKENEGVLDKRFAYLVNRKSCCSIAWSIDLHKFIFLSNKKKIEKSDEKILSDTCEAVVGAIFIDRGYSFASSFVLKLWKQRLKKTNVTILDSKTSLQEYSLKHYKKLPLYRLISSFGPKHNPTFKISVSIQNSKQFFGTGNSKQRAELDAANKLLKTLKLD